MSRVDSKNGESSFGSLSRSVVSRRWNLWCLRFWNYSRDKFRNMRRFHLLAAFCFVLSASRTQGNGIYQANSSDDFYPAIASVFHDIPTCRNLPICRFVERFRSDRKARASALDAVPEYRTKGETGVEARSYYSGYGASPMTPALYPAIDTVSVLASLAFLAFLLHSFASLFDRSRSIFPSIVSNRQAPGNHEVPDPIKLVLRALDEYDILSNNVASAEEKGASKTIR